MIHVSMDMETQDDKARCVFNFSYDFDETTITYKTQFFKTEKIQNNQDGEYFCEYEYQEFKEQKKVIPRVVKTFSDSDNSVHFSGEKAVSFIERILDGYIFGAPVSIERNKNGVYLRKEAFLLLMEINPNY